MEISHHLLIVVVYNRESHAILNIGVRFAQNVRKQLQCRLTVGQRDGNACLILGHRPSGHTFVYAIL